MITQRQLAQRPKLDPQLAMETQRIRERKNYNPKALTCTIDIGDPNTWKKVSPYSIGIRQLRKNFPHFTRIKHGQLY